MQLFQPNERHVFMLSLQGYVFQIENKIQKNMVQNLGAQLIGIKSQRCMYGRVEQQAWALEPLFHPISQLSRHENFRDFQAKQYLIGACQSFIGIEKFFRQEKQLLKLLRANLIGQLGVVKILQVDKFVFQSMCAQA